MFSYLELVELPNGDIVLQKSDDDAEPLVVISFSDEARQHLGTSPLEVARAMIQAGIHMVSTGGEMQVEEEDEEVFSLEGDTSTKTVH